MSNFLLGSRSSILLDLHRPPQSIKNQKRKNKNKRVDRQEKKRREGAQVLSRSTCVCIQIIERQDGRGVRAVLDRRHVSIVGIACTEREEGDDVGVW